MAFLAFTGSLSWAIPAQEGSTQSLPPLDTLASPQEPPVVEVEFVGLESYSREGVLAALGLQVGQPYPQSMRAGLLKVWDTYKIVVGEPSLSRVEGGLKVTVPVTELPLDLQPRFLGYDQIDLDELKEWALLFDREQVYLHEADHIRARLLKGYRQAGYYFVEIENIIGGLGEGAAGDLIFEIREGPKVRCTSITVSGNHSIPNTGWGLWAGGLFSLADIQTQGRGIFRWWGGTFDHEELDADLVALRKVYRDRGWLDVSVGIDELEFSDDRGSVKVHLIVDEGPLWTVGSLDIRGVDLSLPEDAGRDDQELYFPISDLRELTELDPGVPFERARVSHDMRALMRYYGERGYLEQRYFEDANAGGARFLDPRQVYDFENHQVHVTYRIVQGQKRFINEVLVDGNTFTADKVIRRELDFMPGELANIQQIERGLSRIRGTGFFEDPYDPTHIPPVVVFRVSEDDPEFIDVEYQLAEGRVVDFNISGGVASDSGLVGLITLSMRNFAMANTPSGFLAAPGEIYSKQAFHGNGEQFALDLSPGSEISFWRVMYAFPDLLGTHHDRYMVRTEAINRERRFSSHNEERAQANLTFARLFGAGDFSLRLGPRWHSITIDNLADPATAPSTLQDSLGESDLVGLTMDMRYSQLDNRRSPSEGSYYRWGNTFYGGPLGGDENFIKSEFEFDHYLLIGDESEDVRPGFYLGTALGVTQTFSDTYGVHYSERFFLGGSSLRGFDYRGVGPMSGRYSLGGETMARGTIEYRHPIYTTPIAGTSQRQEMFRFLTFVDVGVLGLNEWSLDVDDLRASAGFGFGLVRPLPLTFNFGFPFLEEDGDLRETFSFALDFR